MTIKEYKREVISCLLESTIAHDGVGQKLRENGRGTKRLKDGNGSLGLRIWWHQVIRWMVLNVFFLISLRHLIHWCKHVSTFWCKQFEWLNYQDQWLENVLKLWMGECKNGFCINLTLMPSNLWSNLLAWMVDLVLWTYPLLETRCSLSSLPRLF